jgi:ubiquinone/menaquinone biosynthesis C-methylase UbiE
MFDKYYIEYDKWYDDNRNIFLSELEALKRAIPSDKTGLEIGVGTGRFAEALNIQFGLDPSINMLKLAKSRNISVIKGIGEEIPFKDNSFDFVLIATTLAFIQNINKLFEETKRVVKQSGYVIAGIIDSDSFLGEIYKEKTESKFYSNCKFLSTLQLIEIFKNKNILITEIYQTLFKIPNLINDVEPVKISFGDGGYVVVKGLNIK